MDDLEYWEEMVGESFCENGVKYEPDKARAVAKDMSDAHDRYGMAFYQPPASEHPVFQEIQSLKKELEEERQKVTCRTCNGTGSTQSPVGTSHVSISTCWKCNGQGRHL